MPAAPGIWQVGKATLKAGNVAHGAPGLDVEVRNMEREALNFAFKAPSIDIEPRRLGLNAL